MLEYLNSAVSLNTLIWLFPIAFMLHDFEEIIWIEPWLKKNYTKVIHIVPGTYRKFIEKYAKVTSSQFAVAVLVEFILFIPTTFLAAEKHMYLFFLGFNMAILLHVLGHIQSMIWCKMYTPGVGSALLITAPYSVYVLYRFLTNGIVSCSSVFWSLHVGFLLLPIVIFGHWLGKRLVPMTKNCN
ncbi:hypothetical protein DNHGIG_15340 [Collibacillus ludicampi]|uniref:HXXEE domain-containing protein n=1 Tax=Collibacillus ludicampi TaxID=2771369 RepID=A0AAV4LDT1_9BACL|nr:HXXEE domain-containing protein [Collibacillus ludicampi]GIM45985.1 hypothetical protein DNHGIG_15340 [Collibacillus ludicampi]